LGLGKFNNIANRSPISFEKKGKLVDKQGTTILTLSGACTKKIIDENLRMIMPGIAMSSLQHDECWNRLTQLASPIVASQS
jgi:hypothetical protein